jgi:hypothetical protein
MASTYSKLKIELIGTGDQTGTWGTTTNNNFGSSSGYRGLEQAIVGMATLVTGDFTTNSYTLPYTDTNDDQDFRCLVLDITATLTGAGTVIVPAIQKPYIVMNNSSGGYAVTVKVSGQTGVSVPNGAKVLLYNNGTDVGTAITYLTSLTLGSPLPIASGGTGSTSTTFVNLTTNVTGTLPVGNGGTGISSGTSGGIPYFSGTTSIASSAALAANAIVVGGGAGIAPSTVTTASGILTWIQTPSSANLAAVVTDETGSGALVFGTSPTLTTPRLAGSSTGYTSFASANSSATNYTVTFPAENMTTGFRNIPNTGTKTSSYTFTANDVGKYVQVGPGGSIVVPNSTYSGGGSITDGDVISVINTNTTGITMTFNTTTANISGSSINKGGGGTVTLAARGIASIIFYSSTACVITGAVS